jgi:hypothetical protein
VKADQVGAQHALQQLGPGRQGAEQLLGGKRDMEEEPDPGLRESAPEEAGEQQELIVVHPDQVVLLVLGGDHVGEALVHLDVALPAADLKGHLIEQVVKQGPEDPVGESFVVAGDFVAGEGDADQALGRQLPIEGVLLGGSQRFRRGAGPADPEPIGLLVRAQQAGRQAAGAPLHLHPGVGGSDGDREPVGDDQEPGHEKKLPRHCGPP